MYRTAVLIGLYAAVLFAAAIVIVVSMSYLHKWTILRPRLQPVGARNLAQAC